MVLKREDILAGKVEEQIREAERQGLISRLSPAQRQASKRAVLDQIGEGEIWLFGYGSLMWNPCIHSVDRQTALLHGYRRSFCLRSPTGRGTPERPGLMLALQPGGSCHGVVYRIDAEQAEHELDVVWNREMVSGAYLAQLFDVETPLGQRRAITFVINHDSPRYVPSMPNADAAAIIASAAGWLGSCADYLFNTVEHLDLLGIHDSEMHELQRLVQAHQQREATSDPR